MARYRQEAKVPEVETLPVKEIETLPHDCTLYYKECVPPYKEYKPATKHRLYVTKSDLYMQCLEVGDEDNTLVIPLGYLNIMFSRGCDVVLGFNALHHELALKTASVDATSKLMIDIANFWAHEREKMTDLMRYGDSSSIPHFMKNTARRSSSDEATLHSEAAELIHRLCEKTASAWSCKTAARLIEIGLETASFEYVKIGNAFVRRFM